MLEPLTLDIELMLSHARRRRSSKRVRRCPHKIFAELTLTNLPQETDNLSRNISQGHVEKQQRQKINSTQRFAHISKKKKEEDPKSQKACPTPSHNSNPSFHG
ncbi:hypothetical protein COCC4DRAFT_30478 [Bipolaris maydis ATCC 48331]|uniref:Uncharacterized protein n=2 Tax=Cochliobolus heterostrophus TaxID=5016 RepID=M2TYU5_COCH5|nr:uncharacterized protein COCC4DRAFT_30478 [Bipolaris maydis ATCC 48331]EMD91464.1 hypothetical protein COCHEDRAFT_1021461 [Bipolaris maydis C5]ENI08778.1 hypothetical protein COCC4DRAFT_30478 [Bipolaris maydis ATCC 48331]